MRRIYFLAVLLAVFLGAIYVWRNLSPKPTPQRTCDQTLWKHVYRPSRLKIIDQCRNVTGIIEVIREEKDGDEHILLKLDSEFSNLINAENVREQQGDLVLEPVCVGPVTQKDAIWACSGYKSPIKVPPIGTHVRVTGSYVSDLQHNGWMEIHPVSSIETIN